jgi:hypothetical protein
MFEGDYYIDVGIDNNDFKLILNDNSGNIIKVFDNTPEIVNQAWRELAQLIDNYDLMIYGRVKMYKDGDYIFDLFKRYAFIIFIEQNASYLASLDGYRIKYPNFTYYIATLYKLYKAFVNPKTTLSPQEFILIINPLLTKIRPNLSGQELIKLFDTFAMNYYKAIDYINKERLGLNKVMIAAERPINEEPSTLITQPNEMAIRPAPSINQPNAITASAQPMPSSQNPGPLPMNNPPQVVPQRPPEIVQPKEEITKPIEENKPVPTEEANIRNIKIEHRRLKYSENG